MWSIDEIVAMNRAAADYGDQVALNLITQTRKLDTSDGIGPVDIVEDYTCDGCLDTYCVFREHNHGCKTKQIRRNPHEVRDL